MTPDISEASFEETIDCALRAFGPDACAKATTGLSEDPVPYGDMEPGG